MKLVSLFLLMGRLALAATDINTLVLAPLPTWAHDTLYQGVFLDIDKTMETEKLTRLEAVELQNQTKDAMETGLALQAAFEKALTNVKSGRLESQWKPVLFTHPSEFVVALDMDETLLMQWYSSGAEAGFFDLKVLPDFVGNLKSGPYVRLAPGAENLIRRLKANPLCRGVAIFSAKADGPAIDTVDKWQFADGTPAKNLIDGVFTRNHLVLGKKILVPSKDLRVLDPKLEHVILIDDNPGRVMQPQLLRAHPKFDADAQFHAMKAQEKLVLLHYGTALKNALAEVEESAKASQKLAIPFAQAFLPYSYAGTRIFLSMERTLRSRARALEFTRKNPELLEAAFVPAK